MFKENRLEKGMTERRLDWRIEGPHPNLHSRTWFLKLENKMIGEESSKLNFM